MTENKAEITLFSVPNPNTLPTRNPKTNPNPFEYLIALP